MEWFFVSFQNTKPTITVYLTGVLTCVRMVYYYINITYIFIKAPYGLFVHLNLRS